MVRDCIQDIRFGLRQFARSPVLTAVAVLTLALGIGANTALFSVIDTAMLQRLPVQNPGELRNLAVVTRSGAVMGNVPSGWFAELRQAQSFAGVFGFWRMKANFDTGEETERVLAQFVSGGYYGTLGVNAMIGRTIGESDERGNAHVAVLSHAFWSRRFGGDPAVLGRVINIDGVPYLVVGVTSPGFFGTDAGASPDVTVPLEQPVRYSNLWITVRMKPGREESQALAESQLALQRALEALRPRLSRFRAKDRDEILSEHALLRAGDKGLGLAMSPYTASLRILILLSGLVLLIACVNIANLLLARATGRANEIGVRLAIGASRGRLVRQLLTENSILAVFGGAGGLALSYWMHRGLLLLLIQKSAQVSPDFQVNAHVLIFTSVAATLTLLLFGLAPAVRAAHVDAWSLLKRETRCAGARMALSKALIVGQVAISMLLLFGAGLLLRTLANLNSLDTGLPPENMLLMKVALSAKNYQPAQVANVYQELVARVEAIPGVFSAAVGEDFALGTGSWLKSVWAEGLPPEQSQSAGFNVVGPGFFANAKIPILLGREFSVRDGRGAPKALLVNESFMKQYFGGRNPIGLDVADNAQQTSKYEIVGVVGDTRSMELRSAPGPMIYQCLLQDESISNVVLHVRTRVSPQELQHRVQAEIRENFGVPIYDVTTSSERLGAALWQDRSLAVMSGFFGLLALALTAVGVYGVIAYAVGRRTAEIGVRMALGATREAVLWLILRETAVLVGLGALAGIPLALAGSRFMRTALFGVKPQDPLTASVCVLILIVAGCLAGYVPARRAALLEPVSALRAE